MGGLLMIKKVLNISLLFALIFSLTIPSYNHATVATDYVTATRTVDKQVLRTNEVAEVTLNIKGTPPVNVVKPNDVILIIDKSGSMTADNRVSAAKDAAKGFIDLMDLTTHQVGIVDFSTDPYTRSFPLTTIAADAKSYIDTIQADGGTDTGGAIQKAMGMLAGHRPDAQPVIVLLTDGQANDANYAKQQAQAAKDAGIVFYTIALLSSTENPDSSAPNLLLKEMATTSQHHHFVLGSQGLSEVYSAIVNEIGLASAYDVKVTETVSSEFEIVPGSYDQNIPKPIVSGNTLTWNFLELKNEPLSFKYKIRHKGGAGIGTKPITFGSNIKYKDYAGSLRSYSIPSTTIEVKHPAPIIQSITNDYANVNGGETVVIKGDFFRPGVTVKFNSNIALDVKLINSNEISVVVPPGLQGQARVYVTNDDGQFNKASFWYKAQPVIESVTPANGPFIGLNTVVIKGKNFMPGVKARFGIKEAISVEYRNATEVRAVIPPADLSGFVDIYLENTDGTNVTAPGSYLYNEPIKEELTITNISPSEGLTTGGEIVYIDGKKFSSGLQVLFGDKPAQVATYYSSERIRVIAPPADIDGIVGITVINPDGTQFKKDGAYKYNKPPLLPAPTLISVAPNNGLITGGELVIIEGTNFVKDMKVYFGSTETPIDYYYSPTKIRVKAPSAASAGTVNVSVELPDKQTAVLTNSYTFNELPPPPPPKVTNISSNSGKLSGGEIIYFDGENFISGLKVYFGDKEAPVNSFFGANRFRVIAPSAAQAGAVDLKVVNPDGQEATVLSGYTYLAPPPPPGPTLINVSPNTGLTTGGGLVYIDGTNIGNGATISFGTTTVPIETYYSSSRIRVVAPRSSAGTIDITITNPDGQLFTLPQSYTYTVVSPIITGITPNNGALAGGELVYIDGQYFDPNMRLTVNGVQIQPVDITYYSSSRIRFKIPPSSTAGQVLVVITNPDGLSASTTYTYNAPPATPAPVITKLSVTSGPIAGGTIVYVDGTGFSPNLQIDIGGVLVKPNLFYHSARFRFITPAMSTGIKDVKVINPDGQISNILKFEYK